MINFILEVSFKRKCEPHIFRNPKFGIYVFYHGRKKRNHEDEPNVGAETHVS